MAGWQNGRWQNAEWQDGSNAFTSSLPFCNPAILQCLI